MTINNGFYKLFVLINFIKKRLITKSIIIIMTNAKDMLQFIKLLLSIHIFWWITILIMMY